MRISLLFVMAISALLAVSCSSSKKAVTKQDTKDIACAELQLPASSAHLDWIVEKGRVLNGYTATKLPDNFEVFSIDSMQLTNFFTTAGSAGDTATFATVVPLPDGCRVFKLVPSQIMAEGLQRKYPSIVSLKGNDVNTGQYDLRMNYDGTKMSGQVLTNNTVYTITPIFYNSHTYYIVYQLAMTRISRQQIEYNRMQGGQMQKSSSGR